MSREIDPDYTTQWLFPPAVEDWVGADDPVRFIREYVDALDLEALGFVRPSSPDPAGRPRYSERMLLKAWIFGYFEGIRSSRRLERACRRDVALIWLLGRHEPDHNTLWRFFHRHKKRFEALFRSSVRTALDAGMIGVVLHAVDGTKIGSRGSRRSLRRPEELKRLLEEIDQSIQSHLAAVEEAEEEETGRPEDRLPPELQEASRLRDRIREALEATRPRKLNPAEPEARMMRGGTGQLDLSYNAQAAVDASSGLIIAQRVVTHGNDYHQLLPVLDQVDATLGQVAEQTVADGGYYSGQALSGAEARGYDVLVSLPKTGSGSAKDPFSKPHFVYDPEQDVYHCPRGKLLSYVRTRDKPDRGYSVREYRCRSCGDCPVRDQCTRERLGRRIELSPHDQAIARQRQRQVDPKAQAQLARRPTVVEPVFAWIKDGLGLRRFSAWGQSGAAAQWALSCTVINLKKLLPAWREGRLSFA